MATIRTTFDVADRMSGTLRSMNNAIGAVVTSLQRADGMTNQAFSSSSMIRARMAVDRANAELNEMNENLAKARQNADKASNSTSRLGGALRGVVASYLSFQGLKMLVGLSDRVTQATARINLMNDGLQTTNKLQEDIYKASQRSRASFLDTAGVIAKLGILAGDAFSNNKETIKFAETMNKMFVVGGASAQEQSNAMLQFSQALASGRLQGDELRSISENAPLVIEAIARQLNVTKGAVKQLAAEGKISADVVKNAVLNMSGEIDSRFKSMPMTWGQVATTAMNSIIRAGEPVLRLINKMAQHWDTLKYPVLGLATAVGVLTGALLTYKFATMALVKWQKALLIVQGILEPITIFLGVAYGGLSVGASMATSAQWGFNAALQACPIVWIIDLIVIAIAAVYGLSSAVAWLSDDVDTALGAIAGTALWLFSTICNVVLIPMWNFIAAFVNFLMNCFFRPIASIKILFWELSKFVMDVIYGLVQGIQDLINLIPGVKVNITGGIKNYIGGFESDIKETKAKSRYFHMMTPLKSINTSQAFKTGAKWGDSWFSSGGSKTARKASAHDYKKTPSAYGGGAGGDIGKHVGKIAGDTGAIKNSLATTKEDLKYIRDVAEQKAINRFTTAQITVQQTNHNNMSSDADIDGIVHKLTTGVYDAMDKAAGEGGTTFV